MEINLNMPLPERPSAAAITGEWPRNVEPDEDPTAMEFPIELDWEELPDEGEPMPEWCAVCNGPIADKKDEVYAILNFTDDENGPSPDDIDVYSIHKGCTTNCELVFLTHEAGCRHLGWLD